MQKKQLQLHPLSIPISFEKKWPASLVCPPSFILCQQRYNEEIQKKCLEIYINPININPFPYGKKMLMRTPLLGFEYETTYKGQKVHVLETSFKSPSKMDMMIEFLKKGMKFSHPNVRKIYGVSWTNSHFLILQEPIEGRLAGPCFSEYMPWKNRLRILYDISNGVEYLHRNEIIHRTIQWENILIRCDGTAVLTDYGFSEFADKIKDETYDERDFWVTTSPSIVFANENCSPCQEAWSTKADCYSFGAIMYYLLTGGYTPYFYARSLLELERALWERSLLRTIVLGGNIAFG